MREPEPGVNEPGSVEPGSKPPGSTEPPSIPFTTPPLDKNNLTNTPQHYTNDTIEFQTREE
ncbi:hypothetical protein [Evansella tamaricis]|uniref:hypothetical protein n=1 Tax=Evansella tamaricis TaxID=2069301 RepID=UPI00363C9F28